MVVLTCVVFLVTYALIATERVGRVPAALGGVAALAVLGVVDAEAAFFSPDTGVDWNVIFLLFGMMIIVSVLKQTGLFEYLGLWAVNRSRGRPFRLMALLIWVTAVASGLLDNVTTVLLVAPVTITSVASSACRLGLTSSCWPSRPTSAGPPP
jgi:Na+/H+ antiporter NhaD/arsenite permease-like protein